MGCVGLFLLVGKLMWKRCDTVMWDVCVLYFSLTVGMVELYCQSDGTQQ